MTETEEWLRERIRYSDEYEIVEILVKDLASIADEIEWLRKENQELKLQYLSDQGQWIEETGRLREALREKES